MRPARITTRKLWAPPAWASDPAQLIGYVVERKFKSKWYVGTIVGTDVDEDTNETIWTIIYDDGDAEDLNERELEKYLCMDLQKLL
jgi:hypothetical protein